MSVTEELAAMRRDIAFHRRIAECERICRGKWSLQLSGEQFRAVAHAASVLHLADLKRAGHSPTETELAIGSERGTLVIPRHVESQSYCGSPAATCAGF